MAAADAFGIELDRPILAQLALMDRKQFSVDADATILGYTLDSFNYDAKLGMTWSDSSFPIEASVDEVIMVGPVPQVKLSLVCKMLICFTQSVLQRLKRSLKQY